MMDLQKKCEAVDILAHYLRTAWEAAGLTWTDDNDLEVERLVELIIEAAEEPAP